MATAVGRVSPRRSWCSLAWTTYSTTSGSTMAHRSEMCVTPSTQAVATPVREVESDERVFDGSDGSRHARGKALTSLFCWLQGTSTLMNTWMMILMAMVGTMIMETDSPSPFTC